MSEWQPIETAPMGMMNEVLTYRMAGCVAVAVQVSEGRWCVSDGCEIVNVTHWLPLPAPPKTEEPDLGPYGPHDEPRPYGLGPAGYSDVTSIQRRPVGDNLSAFDVIRDAIAASGTRRGLSGGVK